MFIDVMKKGEQLTPADVVHRAPHTNLVWCFPVTAAADSNSHHADHLSIAEVPPEPAQLWTV